MFNFSSVFNCHSNFVNWKKHHFKVCENVINVNLNILPFIKKELQNKSQYINIRQKKERSVIDFSKILNFDLIKNNYFFKKNNFYFLKLMSLNNETYLKKKYYDNNCKPLFSLHQINPLSLIKNNLFFLKPFYKIYKLSIDYCKHYLKYNDLDNYGKIISNNYFFLKHINLKHVFNSISSYILSIITNSQLKFKTCIIPFFYNLLPFLDFSKDIFFDFKNLVKNYYVNTESFINFINRMRCSTTLKIFSCNNINNNLFIQMLCNSILNKQVLVPFLYNQKDIELVFNSKNLNSVLIRLKLNDEKFISLELIPNNIAVQEMLESNIEHLRHTLLNSGYKFKNIIITDNDSINNFSFSYTSSFNKKFQNNYSIIKSEKNKNINSLLFLESQFFQNNNNVIDIYI